MTPTPTAPAATPVHYRWNDVTAEPVGTLGSLRRFVTGDHLTVARFDFKRGAIAQPHTHDSEEVLCVLRGALKVVANGQETLVREGEVVRTPGGVEHQVEVLEDAEVIGVFSPIRQDWLDKTDHYFGR